MKTLEQIEDIVSRVRLSLTDYNRAHGTELHVPDEGWVESDEWLYVIVTPANKTIRGSEYVEALDDLETDLRKVGIDHVLLVPARPE